MKNCNECDDNFDNEQSLKKHKISEHKKMGSFKCDKCDFQFHEEWKLEGHKQICKSFSCDQCDLSFKTLDILKTHVKITYEKIKIYCHYFNNDKKCPYDDKC